VYQAVKFECEGIIPPFYYPIVSFSSIRDLMLNCSTNIAFAYMIYLNTCVCIVLFSTRVSSYFGLV
jgi:hypothetical protein